MATQEEPELVELHFELEIDFHHAFQEDQVITTCVAEVMGLKPSDVAFDGVEQFERNNAYYGLLRGHIPTTKHAIEGLVKRFYHSLQTGTLREKIAQYSGIQGALTLDIRELYETDQNDPDMDDQQEMDEVTPFDLTHQQQHSMEQREHNSQNPNSVRLD